MEKPFFIMLCLPGNITPISYDSNDGDKVAFFESIEEAVEFTSDHPACQAFRYEIFELGMGAFEN